MNILVLILRVMLGVVCGGCMGLALGFLTAMGVGLVFKWVFPNDPSAGSVAIIVIITAPLGAIFGAIFGGLFMTKRRVKS